MSYDATTEVADGGTAKEDIVATGRDLFGEWIGTWADNRAKYLEDMRFVWQRGAQWPEFISTQRERDKRPTLEINQMPQYVRQITNDQRQNRPSIRVRPVGGGATDKLAELYSGVIRGIEYESNAAAAYDTGFECSVVGGFGAWRVITEYKDEDSFDQVIRIRRVANPLCVVIDPMYAEADASDMKGAYVYEEMTREEFKRRWPNAKPVDFSVDMEGFKAWCNNDNIIIADWYRCEYKTKYLYGVPNPEGGHTKINAEQFAQLDEESQKTIEKMVKDGAAKKRAVDVKVIVMRKMTGNQILEEQVWPGKYVPVVPCFADESNIEGEKILQGFVRRGRDPQQMYNYWASSATERVALSPKAPWVGYRGQFKDFKWRTANDKNWAYLEVEPTLIDGKPAPLPQRQSIDADASGVIGMAQAARFDLQSTLGMYDASLGKQSNEISGRAIVAREKQGDTGTFHYIDNLSRAIRYTGRILVDLIPKIYDTERVLRIVKEDQTEAFETVNKQNLAAAAQIPPEMGGGGGPQDPATMAAGVMPPPQAPDPSVMGQQMGQMGPPGAQPMPGGAQTSGMPPAQPVAAPGGPQSSASDMAEQLNDLSVGEYDIVVDTGPSFATKRLESVEAMTEFMQADPSAVALIGDLYVGQMDWPMARKIAERLRFRLPPAVLQAEASEDPKMAMAMAPLQQQLQQLSQANQTLTMQMQQLTMQNTGLKADSSAKIETAHAKMAEVQHKASMMEIEANTADVKSQAEVMKALAAVENADAKSAQMILGAIVQMIKLQQTQKQSVIQEAAGMTSTVERIYDMSTRSNEEATHQQERQADAESQSADASERSARAQYEQRPPSPS